MTDRRNLEVRDLNCGVWLVSDPSYAAGVQAEAPVHLLETPEAGVHAEIVEVWARDEVVSIVFVIAAPTGTTPVVDSVILRTRDRRSHRRYAVRRDDRGRLHTDIPIAGLDPGSRPVDHIWDVYAATVTNNEDRVELRVGKHLDDIVGKKRIITFPTQRPAGAESLAVTPYYTLHDNLSIRCRSSARKA